MARADCQRRRDLRALGRHLGLMQRLARGAQLVEQPVPPGAAYAPTTARPGPGGRWWSAATETSCPAAPAAPASRPARTASAAGCGAGGPEASTACPVACGTSRSTPHATLATSSARKCTSSSGGPSIASAGPAATNRFESVAACSARVQSKQVPAASRRLGDRDVAEHVGHGHRRRVEQRPRIERDRQQEPVVAVAQREVEDHQRRRRRLHVRVGEHVDQVELHGPVLEGPEAGIRHARRSRAVPARGRHGAPSADRSRPTSRSPDCSKWYHSSRPSVYSGAVSSTSPEAPSPATENAYSMCSGDHVEGPDDGSSKRSPAHDSHARSTVASADRSAACAAGGQARTDDGRQASAVGNPALHHVPPLAAFVVEDRVGGQRRTGPRRSRTRRGVSGRPARAQHAQQVQAGLGAEPQLLQPGFAHGLALDERLERRAGRLDRHRPAGGDVGATAAHPRQRRGGALDADVDRRRAAVVPQFAELPLAAEQPQRIVDAGLHRDGERLVHGRGMQANPGRDRSPSSAFHRERDPRRARPLAQVDERHVARLAQRGRRLHPDSRERERVAQHLDQRVDGPRASTGRD